MFHPPEPNPHFFRLQLIDYNWLNDNCLLLYTILRHLSWKRFILLSFLQLWSIHINRPSLICALKNMRHFGMLVKGLNLDNTYILRLAFLNKSGTFSSKVGLLSNLTLKSFFKPAVFWCFLLFTFRLIFLRLLAQKWRLSPLLFWKFWKPLKQWN